MYTARRVHTISLNIYFFFNLFFLHWLDFKWLKRPFKYLCFLSRTLHKHWILASWQNCCFVGPSMCLAPHGGFSTCDITKGWFTRLSAKWNIQWKKKGGMGGLLSLWRCLLTCVRLLEDVGYIFFFLFTKSWAFKSSEKLTAYVSIIVQQLEAEQLKPVVAI